MINTWVRSSALQVRNPIRTKTRAVLDSTSSPRDAARQSAVVEQDLPTRGLSWFWIGKDVIISLNKNLIFNPFATISFLPGSADE